jgi:hypothetical protein
MECIEGIMRLDAMKLRRGDVSSGVVGAYIAICEYEPNPILVNAFIRNVHDEGFQPLSRGDDIIVMLRSELDARRKAKTNASGGGINDIRDLTFTRFMDYRNAKKSRKAVSASEDLMTLGDFSAKYGKKVA